MCRSVLYHYRVKHIFFSIFLLFINYTKIIKINSHVFLIDLYSILMNTPSEEQQHIIDQIKIGKNVIVHAVAGSGKSTTVLSMSDQLKDKKILQLTYNSSLRLEIKDKTEKLGLENIDIHTFHSLAVKHYAEDAHNDTGIRRILTKHVTPRIPIDKIDILVIDENQDSTLLYFRFVVYFLLHMKSRVQIVCLGDVRQCIYQFKGADSRYLSMAQQIWSGFSCLKSDEFVHCTLLTSYRITDQIGDFINEVMMGENMMVTCRQGPNVMYIRNNRVNVENILLHKIRDILSNGHSPEEIFILNASIKTSNVRKLENKLVMENIPCFVPNYESEKLDERVISGKIVFSTFHSVKGRQRPFVFILGFDNNYFTHFARDMIQDICPNTLYVGASRPQQQLFVVEYDQFPTDKPLKFLRKSHRELNRCEYVSFNGLPRNLFDDNDGSIHSRSDVDKRFETPTKMVQFIPEHVLDTISAIVDDVFVEKHLSVDMIDLPSVHATRRGFEDVSDLNGIAIPAYFYWKKTGKNLLKQEIDTLLLEMKEHEHTYLKTVIEEIPETCETIDEYLFLTNVYVSLKEKLYFRLKQIECDEYNWIKEEILEKCMQRLDELLAIENNEELIFEHNFIHHSFEELHVNKIDPLLHGYFPGVLFRFSALADVVTHTALCEIKCTSNINIEHKLQLIIYAWLWRTLDLPEKRFRLLNVKTGEWFEMECSLEQLTNIVVEILKGRYMEYEVKTDRQFFRSNIKMRNQIVADHMMNEFIDELCCGSHK